MLGIYAMSCHAPKINIETDQIKTKKSYTLDDSSKARINQPFSSPTSGPL